MTIFTRFTFGLALAALVASTAAPTRPTQRKNAHRLPKRRRFADRQTTRLAREAPRAIGIKLSWVEFQSGPPLLEALNSGAIDFGQTGDTPPIYAQARLAAGVSGGAPTRQTQRHSRACRRGITTIADLKGKRVAFTRGSSAHNIVVRLLATAA